MQGDILRLRSRQEVPCDCLLLYAAGCSGICYVSTANIDGETTLKPRIPVETLGQTEAANFRAELFADKPSK